MNTFISWIKRNEYGSWQLYLLYIMVIVFALYTIKTTNDIFDYLSNQNMQVAQRIDMLEVRLASTTDSLAENINVTKVSLSSQIEREKSNLNQQLGNVQGQVGSLTGTLSSIEKLSKIDPELLKKYSKVYFLNEHYAPVALTEIPSEYVYSDKKTPLFHSQAWPFLQRLLDDAKREGIDLYVFSAYRSFNEQHALKNQYTVVYGAGTANQFSADQGYSEHQLGTALDFMTKGINGELDGFDRTSAYTWLSEHAHTYGFILSYPKGNTQYIFEPWHWRFVGVALATYLHSTGTQYYTTDQREMDSYLINLFD